MEEQRLKADILTGARILAKLGLFEDNSGHLSGRIPNTSRFWMIGHIHDRGLAFEELTEEHLVCVDAETEEWEGNLEPPGEYYIHSGIYRARPDVGGVVHCHPTYPVALSVAGQQVLPVHHWGEPLWPAVPLMEEHRQIDTHERGVQLADALGSHQALVLRAHGSVTVGEDLAEAVVHTVVLDRCARLQYLACQVGEPRPIPVDAPRPLSRERIEKLWSLYA